MLKIISVIGTSALICSCGLMPGMKNLDTSNMRKVYPQERIEVHPVLIPITPALIINQKVGIYHYRIAPSDVLSINVWQHPEFDFMPTNTLAASAGVQGAAGHPGYLVNANGQIYFPLIGYVSVVGRTVETVRVNITERLKRYVPNPQVNVRVADYRGQKIYVLGEVKNPNFLPINDQPLTIADALALSGGMNPDAADPRYIFIIRGSITSPQIFWLDAKTPDKMLLAERFSLHPRDILFVSSAPATRWNRVLNQLLPTIQSVWYTQALIRNG